MRASIIEMDFGCTWEVKKMRYDAIGPCGKPFISEWTFEVGRVEWLCREHDLELRIEYEVVPMWDLHSDKAEMI